MDRRFNCVFYPWKEALYIQFDVEGESYLIEPPAVREIDGFNEEPPTLSLSQEELVSLYDALKYEVGVWGYLDSEDNEKDIEVEDYEEIANYALKLEEELQQTKEAFAVLQGKVSVYEQIMEKLK